MKTLSLLPSLFAAAIAAITLISCQNESRNNTDPRGTASNELAEDLETPLPSLPYLVVFDEVSEQLYVEKDPDFDRATLSVDALTQALVSNYPEIPLTVDRVSGDTLYAQIVDAQYLTQQMGSTGAQTYLLEVTYAYTELPNIQAVNFAFQEGDHATPGTYTRERFKKEALVQ